jgi:hypothetical protein
LLSAEVLEETELCFEAEGAARKDAAHMALIWRYLSGDAAECAPHIVRERTIGAGTAPPPLASVTATSAACAR